MFFYIYIFMIEIEIKQVVNVVDHEGYDIHTVEFRDNAKTPEAFQKMIRAAKCMALTGIKVMSKLSSYKIKFIFFFIFFFFV